MYILVQCAVCLKRKGQEKMEQLNKVPVCSACNDALTALDTGDPTLYVEGAAEFIDKVTERIHLWWRKNEEMVNKKDKYTQDAAFPDWKA